MGGFISHTLHINTCVPHIVDGFITYILNFIEAKHENSYFVNEKHIHWNECMRHRSQREEVDITECKMVTVTNQRFDFISCYAHTHTEHKYWFLKQP